MAYKSVTKQHTLILTISANLSPSDYHLFPALKQKLSSGSLKDDNRKTVLFQLLTKNKDFY